MTAKLISTNSEKIIYEFQYYIHDDVIIRITSNLKNPYRNGKSLIRRSIHIINKIINK